MPINDSLRKKIQAILKSPKITEKKLQRLLAILTKENQAIIKLSVDTLCQNSLSDVLQDMRDFPENRHSSLSQHTLLLRKKYISFIDSLIDDTASLFDRVNQSIEKDQSKLCLFETMGILDNIHLSTLSDLKKKWKLIHERTFDSRVPQQINFHLQRYPDSLITKTACLHLCMTLGLQANAGIETTSALISIRKWTEDSTRKVGENVEKNISGFNIDYMVNSLLRQAFKVDLDAFNLLVNSLDLLDSNWRQQNRITDDAIGQSLSDLHGLHNNQTKPERKSNSLRNKSNQTFSYSHTKKTPPFTLAGSATLKETPRNNRSHANNATRSFAMFLLLSGLGYALYYLLAKQGQNQLHASSTSRVTPPRSFVNNSFFYNMHQTSPVIQQCNSETVYKVNTLVTNANKGDVESQYFLGDLYEEIGINQDVEESRYFINTAAYWYHRAATEGKHTKSQVALAKLLERKLVDVKHDYKTARYWYEKAANNNDDGAQYQLAQWHYRVTKNLKTAVFWLRKSANHGNHYAQFDLGTMYERGEGIRVDYKEAMKLYRKSAMLGYKHSQYNLGAFYHNGLGVEINYNKAAYWFELAAKQGLEDAQNILDDYNNLGILDKLSRNKNTSNHEQEIPGSTLITVYNCNVDLLENSTLLSCSTNDIVNSASDSSGHHNETQCGFQPNNA